MSLAPAEGPPSAGLKDGPQAWAQRALRERPGEREPASSPPCTALPAGSQSLFWKPLSGVKEWGPCINEVGLCSQPHTYF